jgi:hypothetical protein
MTTRHEPGMTTFGEEERQRTSGTTGTGYGTFGTTGMGTGTTAAGGVGAGGYGRIVLTIKSGKLYYPHIYQSNAFKPPPRPLKPPKHTPPSPRPTLLCSPQPARQGLAGQG